jgi:Glycosyltransferase family 92
VSDYLSACAIYRDEASYLQEWIEFHRLVGIEHFFLYDNGSVDEHRTVLAPYEREGIVTLHDWPRFPGQKPAYRHCFEHYADRSRWVAVLDLDEFLFSPTGEPVAEVLRDFEDWPGVVVNRATYGTSGHRTRPPGLVVESYVRRMSEEHPQSVKSIIDPSRARRVENPHAFAYDRGLAVDEHKREVEGWFTEDFTFERLRVNHYWTKSEEECERKFSRTHPVRSRPWPGRPDRAQHERANEVFDDLLVPYGARIRAAIERSPAEA